MTSRGCPYRCTFCSQSIMPIKWRSRSPENVLAEWRHLVEDLGAEEIGVLDDSANIRIKRLEELAHALDREQAQPCAVDLCQRHPRQPGHQGNARAAQAGRPQAHGLWRGDRATPRFCARIDKKVDHDTIRQAFKNAKEIDLETIAFMIIGLPGETRETMQRTIDFAIELDPVIANFSMMTPYPGTKVYEIVKRQGRFLINDWEDYVFFEQKARYEMGEMTAELVEEMYRKAYRQLLPAPFADHAPPQDQGFLDEPAAQHAHRHEHLRAQEGKDRPAQGG